jgi:1-aminocyclopropane-1-carboxylate deaminase/D-cysteine desulfhydrase-like pyridoxal-dependent ACC family enzyme
VTAPAPARPMGTGDGTVFRTVSLDRSYARWEDMIETPTPVQVGASGIRYKREDWFAPLGYGGINGSKLRQLLVLALQHQARGGYPGLVTGASVLSPQHSMAALVARHFGWQSRHVLGATRPDSAIRHENIAIAAAAGATFDYVPVGFNPALQRAVADLADAECAGWFRLHYGITTAAGCAGEDVEAFHRPGAYQVRNLPADTRQLVMTLGSANSAASVLYGLARHRPAGLERVVLLGIGPTRLRWLMDRLERIERVTGHTIRALFRPEYHHHPDLQTHLAASDAPYVLEHYDLHDTGFTHYQQKRRFTHDGIVFHPTYEGKALAYLAADRDRFRWFWDGGEAVFWIVGSEPKLAAMKALAA